VCQRHHVSQCLPKVENNVYREAPAIKKSLPHTTPPPRSGHAAPDPVACPRAGRSEEEFVGTAELEVVS
jgi:hypothetical protein